MNRLPTNNSMADIAKTRTSKINIMKNQTIKQNPHQRIINQHKKQRKSYKQTYIHKKKPT